MEGFNNEDAEALEPQVELCTLPNEILMEILGYLDSITLEDVCSRVCKRWREISDMIIDKRLEPVWDSVLRELKTRVPLDQKEDKACLLQAYERTSFSPKVQISQEVWESDFIRKIYKKRACDCNDVDVCITRVIHFMPCHKLVLVQIPEEIYYFHETDPFVHQKEIELEPYGTYTDTPAIRVDNNTHAAISVYHDRVVVQETPRVLALFRVATVDHEQRRIRIERIRRIFLPIWSCALSLHDRKIFILYTTRYVGVWHEEQDALAVSDAKCGSSSSVEPMRLTMMYRCNDLIFIKQVSTSKEINWTVIDATEETINLHAVPLTSLINVFCSNTNKGECVRVHQICAWNNTLILHCKISDGTASESKILVARMRQELKRDHFLSQHSFQELFHDSSRNVVVPVTFHGSVTSPFPSTSFAASIIGIQKGGLRNHRGKKRLWPLCRIDFQNEVQVVIASS